MLGLNSSSRTFVIQVLGLLLLWCLAIYTLYQIRYASFQSFNIPVPKVDLRLIIFNENTDPPVEFPDTYRTFVNLPLDYWNENKDKFNEAVSCGRFPNPFRVEFHQTYWQTYTTSNKTARILNAYLDSRQENPSAATVRILAMTDINDVASSTYCQLWFEDQTAPVIVKTSHSTNIWYNNKAELLPYLINCEVPTEYNKLVPKAVSLVERPCDNASNILRVYYNKYENKKEFAVCVKGLDDPEKDSSIELVEWIELLNILGTEKLFFYNLNLHPNVKKVLTYYENKGQAQVTPLKLAESSYELTKMQKELIPYTDCFYKNMYKFKYVVILDIDEVLLPLKMKTWKSVLPFQDTGTTDENAIYKVRSLYFSDSSSESKNSNNDIPPYMKMLLNIYRKNDATKIAPVQAFFNTEKILTLHNDLPVKCLASCLSYSIEEDKAQLQHYRDDCAFGIKKNCMDFTNGTVVDNHIWNFKENLVEQVASTLNALGISPV